MESTAKEEQVVINYWSPDYGNLPVEIIEHIFGYLHHSDRQAAGATCSNWRDALFIGEFKRSNQVHFAKVCLSDRLPPAKYLLKCQRLYRNYYLDEVTFGQIQELTAFIGQSAVEITFDNVEIGDKQFYAFMRLLTNLESLTITRCSSLFMSGAFLDGVDDLGNSIASIRRLSLQQNQYLSDAIFLRLTSLIKSLESLNMSGCHIAYHNAIQRRFYPNENTHANESILTFKFITKIILNHRKHFRELDLSHTMISGPALESLGSRENIEGVKLHRLKLTSCRQLNTASMMAFIQTQPSLVVLDLADTLCMNNDCLAAVVENIPKLTSLNIAGCTALNNEGAALLGNLKCLKYLNISRCDGITTEGLKQGIARALNTHLRCLQMSHLKICEEGIKCIAFNCPELRVLNVGHCVNGVTDASVQYIVQHLTWLRDLSLENCFWVSDAALTGINLAKLDLKASHTRSLDNFNPLITNSLHERDTLNTSLQSMKISLRSKAEEDIVRDANRKRALFAAYELNSVNNVDGFCIQQLKGLCSLNIKGCNKITDVTLIYGLKCNELKRLFLSSCQQITSVGMESLVVNCPAIEELDLSECYNINDKTIQLITAKLSRLRALHISGCSQLTDHSLDAILVNCKSLNTLSVHRCRRIYADIEDRLSELSTLRNLNMDNANSMENPELFRLKRRLDY
ncbi:uncharacterized protein ACN2A1_002200 [Glossina fuscipes fuscipes]